MGVGVHSVGMEKEAVWVRETTWGGDDHGNKGMQEKKPVRGRQGQGITQVRGKSQSLGSE